MADATINIDVKVSPPDPLGRLIEQTKQAEANAKALREGFVYAFSVFEGLKAFKGAFDFIIDSARNTEDLTKQLLRFTGTAEEAKNQLDALSQIPGPSLNELVAADKILLSFGSTAKQSVAQLKALNDVAVASGAKIEDLANIFGKVQGEGNLTSQTFKQFSKEIAGFANDFSDALGIPEQSFKRLANQGKITSDQLNQAFQKLTSEGGKYFGQAEGQASTLTGSFNSLSDNTKALAANIGTLLTPALSKLVSGLSDAAASSSDFFKKSADFQKMNENGQQIARLTLNIESLRGKLQDLENGNFSLDTLLIGRPQAIDETINRIHALQDEIDKLGKPQRESDRLAKIQADAIEAEKIQKASDDRIENKKQEALGRLADLQKAADQDKVNKIQEIQKTIIDLEAQNDGVRNELILARGQENNQARINQLLELQAENLAAIETARIAEFQLESSYDDLALARVRKKEQDETDAKRKAEADRSLVQKKARQDEFNTELAYGEAKKKFEEQTYAQSVQTADKGLAALAGLQKTGNRDAFNIGKRAAQARVLLAIPTAAMEAYTSLVGIPIVGPVLATAAAAAAVATGLFNVKQIESQQMPAFAQGGLVPGTGNQDNVPALLTPGEVVVPKTSFADLQAGMQQSGVAADQIVLLQQGNAISAKILDQLTIGIVNEKLTTIIATLNEVVVGIDKIAVAAANNGAPNGGLDPTAVAGANRENERNTQGSSPDVVASDNRRAQGRRDKTA